MKFDPVKNPQYVATVVSVSESDLQPLPGLDNLVAYRAIGMQALVSKGTPAGLYLLFSTEVQLSLPFAKANNLHRDGLANADPLKKGYLEQNRRVKAIKLRGHRSDSLLMPITALSYLLSAKDLAGLKEGDVFDSIGGHEVCRKYVVKPSAQGVARPKVRRVPRVDVKVFPEHIDSENYWRNAHKIPPDAPVTVTQKLHGTSVRYGNVPALVEQTWWQRLLRRPQALEHQLVVGSRRTVKSVGGVPEDDVSSYYGTSDLWTDYAAEHRLADLIPKDHVVYGELVGFTSDGKPIQKGYTYDALPGQAKLYVYRVAVVTADGISVDYTPAQLEVFCQERKLAVVPLLWAGRHGDFDPDVWTERRYYEQWADADATYSPKFASQPVPLSDKKTVDEGVCVRYDGPFGAFITKAKSPTFLVFESKALDAGVEDVESAESEPEVVEAW